MIKKITLLLTALVCLNIAANAEENLKYKITGYIDTYVSVENDNQKSKNGSANYDRQLTYINPKKDNLGLNIAMINFNANYGKARTTFTLQAGQLVNSAYGVGNGATKTPLIQQANIGYNLFDNIWMDAGYFMTHIGGESFLPKDNWLSSHSLVTFFEPFYQAGLRFSYETDNFNAQLHILNGNGMIEDNNANKTFGIFLSYKPFKDLFVSYANVMGNEEADTMPHINHMLHNVCLQYDFTKEFSAKAQFDMANKSNFTKADSTKADVSYMGASLSLKYAFTETISSTFRFAYVNNEDGLYSPALKGIGLTLGAEYKPTSNSYLRLEGTMYSMDDKFELFKDNDSKPSKSKMELMLNFGIVLD